MVRMKCFLSFLIVMTLLTVQTALTPAVSAEETEALPSVTVTEEDLLRVEKLEAFGAITNEYEDIGMYVTRRQMVDIIIQYLRMQVSGMEVTKSPFLDVRIDDRAISEISALYNAGIITGDDTLRFYPDAYLTYDDALVFVVNAVGYKFFAAREGGYPTGYHRIAVRYGMLRGLKFLSGKNAIPLCDVYKMLESALEVGAVIPVYLSDGSVDYTVSSDETFLSDLYEIKEYQGTITGNENTHLTYADSNLTDEQIEINGVVYDTPGYVYATSLGRAVNYYLRKTADRDYDVAFVEENKQMNNLIHIDSEDLLPAMTTESRLYYTDDQGKERHLNMEVNVDVIYNNKCYRGYGTIENVLPAYGFIEALDNTGDDTVDVLFVYDYKNIVVGAVDTYENSFTSMFENEEGIFEEFVFENDDENLNLVLMPSGRDMSLQDLQKWDVATIMESKSNPALYTIYVSRDTVTGTVEEVSEEKGCLIGGTYYEIADSFIGDAIRVGSNAVFHLDFNNKIAATDKTAITATGDLAVLSGIDYGNNPVTSEVQIRLFTADGNLITVPLASSINIDGTRFKTSSGELENTLSYLSRGIKSETGRYYIETPYVVHYRLSNGQVSYLDTGMTGEEGKLRQFAAGDSFLTRPGGILRALNGTSNTGEWIYTYYKSGETVIFSTPPLEDLDDAEGYSVTNSLSDHWYYRNTDVYGSQYSKHTQSYAMYNYTSEGIASAKVILLVGTAASSSAINANTSSFNVVTKLSTAVNEEGSLTRKIYLNEGLELLFAERVDIKAGATSYTNVEVDKIDEYLQPGTAIQYGTDKHNAIDNVSIMATYDAATGTVTQVFDDAGIPGEKQDNKMLGRVANISATDGILQIAVESEGSTAYLLPVNNASVTVYRPDREKATSGSADSIAEGDIVLARMTEYYRVHEIIVYKQ